MVGGGNNLVKPENMNVETYAKARTKRGVEEKGKEECKQVQVQTGACTC